MRRLLTMATLVVAVALGLWLAVGASASPVHRATTGGVKTAAVTPASGQQVASTHRNGSTSASAKQVTGSKLSQAERAGESESASETRTGARPRTARPARAIPTRTRPARTSTTNARPTATPPTANSPSRGGTPGAASDHGPPGRARHPNIQARRSTDRGPGPASATTCVGRYRSLHTAGVQQQGDARWPAGCSGAAPEPPPRQRTGWRRGRSRHGLRRWRARWQGRGPPRPSRGLGPSRPPEPFERMREKLLGEAGTGVDDLHHHLLALGVGPNSHRCLRWRDPEGVVDQVVDRLAGGCPSHRGTSVAARRVIRRHPPWRV